MELGYLFFLPKSHQGLAYTTTKGHSSSQVALSQQFSPSKSHNCSLPRLSGLQAVTAPLPLALESLVSPARRL